MKLFFPLHLNGGNRGCEGIALGTSKVLGFSKDKMIGLSTDIDLDVKLGLSSYYTLESSHRIRISFEIIDTLYRAGVKIGMGNDPYLKSVFEWRYLYSSFFSQMHKDDVMLSTGGDMFCYGDNIAVYTNQACKARGQKTILWGCSIGEENVTLRKMNTLREFDAIYTRESLTYEFLMSAGLKSVFCYPDPAFILEPQEVDLPPVFYNQKKSIGINLSNYTMGGESLESKFAKEVLSFIDYLIKETDYNLVLIPHVMWKGQDDRIISDIIFKAVGNPDRLSVLDSNKYTYQQLRYIISKFYIFIGSRTHAVISAYSTCVPSLAIGYSIKSRGIAKDLGLPDMLVINSKVQEGSNRLITAFEYLITEWSKIHSHLCESMPQYISKIEEAREILNCI